MPLKDGLMLLQKFMKIILNNNKNYSKLICASIAKKIDPTSNNRHLKIYFLFLFYIIYKIKKRI